MRSSPKTSDPDLDAWRGNEFLDALSDVVVVADGSGVITFVNRAVESLLGRLVSDVVGHHIATLIPERLRSAHRKGFEAYMAGGAPRLVGGPPVAVPALHADGSEVEVELVLTERHDDRGEREFIGVLRDVSARVDMQRLERLHRHIALTGDVAARVAASIGASDSADAAGRVVLETVGGALGWDAAVLWSVDVDGVSQPVNWWTDAIAREAMAEMAADSHRFDPGRGLPGRVVAFQAPAWIEDIEADRDYPRQVIAERHGLRSAFAFPILTADRVFAVVELLSATRRSIDAELIGFVGQIGRMVGQLVERRIAEDELAAREARKVAILDSAFDAVVSIDADGAVTSWNRAAEETFGWSATEAIGTPMADLIVPAGLRDAHLAGLRRHLETGETHVLGRPLQLTARRRSGEEFDAEIAIIRLHGAEPPEFTGFIRDITERVRAQSALAANHDRLHNLARTLQESLLPASPPTIEGLDVGTTYRPAGDGSEVGGDFYDIFATGPDRWTACIGDVCGKGAEAARVTALVRYTIRTAASQHDDPVEVVRVCNSALLADEGRRLTTGVVVQVVPGHDTTRLHVVRAGHLPPLVLRADGSTEMLEPDGAILGLFADPVLESMTVDLGRGDALVLYTDGVTEAQVDGTVLGETALGDIVAGLVGLDAQSIADEIGRVAVDLQNGMTRDDLAVVVLRQPVA